MSKEQYSSGPWVIDPCSDDETTAICRLADDEHICLIHSDREMGVTETELANARLIAAAPDLFAACKVAVAEAEGAVNPSARLPNYKQMRAALKLAGADA